MSRNDDAAADVAAMIRARVPIVWVVTQEEKRVERAIIGAAASVGYSTECWDVADGLQVPGRMPDRNYADPSAMVGHVREAPERTAFVLRDLHDWLDPILRRRLRSLARDLPSLAKTVVVVTPSNDVPRELVDSVTVIDWPLPERPELGRILTDLVEALPEAKRADAVTDRDAAIDAAVGLSAEEAANCFARSLVATRGSIDPAIVSGEKKRVIAREKVLTWYDPDPRGLDAIGGLAALKRWLQQRKLAFGAEARAYGLPSPRGMLLVGVPGTGKSLTAKCVASAWGVPLLRLDLGALKSKWIGESEANIRKALATAETVSPCVLWLDEIEKALGGSTSPQGDGGVSSDALGAVLSWMQERRGAVFVVATANDVRSLPPELLRKGRFDELFWVDLPTRAERVEIVRASLAAYERDQLDADRIAAECDGFTGAEIAAAIPDAMFAAFADGGRALREQDVLDALAQIVPLSKTSADKIGELRDWARGRARPAGATETIRDDDARRVDF